MDIIRQLQEWHKEDIYQELLTIIDKHNQSITVSNVLRAIDSAPFITTSNNRQPYHDLVQALGGDTGFAQVNQHLLEAMVYIFNHDPSRQRESVDSVDACFQEQPFPRYLVSICYALLRHRCVSNFVLEHDYSIHSPSPNQSESINTLRDAIWYNMADTGNMRFYPSTMLSILTDFFSTQELLDRAIILLGEPSEMANLVGDIVLEQLSLEQTTPDRTTLEQLSLEQTGVEADDDIIQKLQQTLKNETDPAKRQRYKAYLQRRQHSILRSILDMIAPWTR